MDTMIFGLSLKTLSSKVDELVEFIRAYSLKQKELWQQVPYLALQVDSRSGSSYEYSLAYQKGFWRIESSIIISYYSVVVDCATGRLVCMANTSEDARASDLIRCAARLEDLDANAVLNELRKKAQEPHFKGCDIVKSETRRKKIQQGLDLKELYVRNCTLSQL
ncbi:MAG: hypothetical protein NTZ36_00165 [Candidatus Jorgensenbacteria bacterium]|nr:hypothetical protein [Candidatus Jorgensenbacteria bacterium]